MRLINLDQKPTEEKPTPRAPAGKPSASSVIEQLRFRLLNRDCHDSVEVRTVLLGELVYQCYVELTKRRYL